MLCDDDDEHRGGGGGGGGDVNGAMLLMAVIPVLTRACAGMKLLHAWGTSICDADLESALVSLLNVRRRKP